MAFPISNLPEEYIYQLLPAGVINLDTRFLIEAVLGGYQDRISDLRSFSSKLSSLNDPSAPFPETANNVVLVKFMGPAGQTITRSLDIDPSAPSFDDTVNFRAWVVQTMGIQDSSILAISMGTDLLRKVSLDTLTLLASNVGCVLFPGIGDDLSDDNVRATRQKLLESYFPRLRLKGTAASYEMMGKSIGFNNVSVVPLWSKLSPHDAVDIGSSLNDDDFSAKPDQVPSSILPDSRYDPHDFRDGEFYKWASGPLSESDADFSYWPNAINKRNPFVTVAVIGNITRPVPGKYTLDGGAPNRKATVLLDYGTVTSNLKVSALAEGASFNGMKVQVVDFGTAAGLSITDRMSSTKYRSSYFDIKASIATAGTISVQPSPDLESNPSLTPDGVAAAPFRPWIGGNRYTPTSVWPSVSTVYGSVAATRIQAAGSVTQYNPADFEEAQKVSAAFDSLKPATRTTRRSGVGLGFYDYSGFADYPSQFALYNAGGTGTFFGSVFSPSFPIAPYIGKIAASSGNSDVQVYSDDPVPGISNFASQAFSGSYNFNNNTWKLQVTDPSFAVSGTVYARYTASGTNVRVEPSDAIKIGGSNVSRLDRPEDSTDFSRNTTAIHDDYPWGRNDTFAGTPVDRDLYLPATPDLDLRTESSPYFANSLSGGQKEIAVLDAFGTSLPYRYRIINVDEIDPITGNPSKDDYNRFLMAKGPGSSEDLYHILLVDKVLIASQYWSKEKNTSICQWVPFNEHPLDAVEPFNRYATFVDSNLSYTSRTWDANRGWVTKISNGDSVAFYSGASIGTTVSGAVWVYIPSAGAPSVISPFTFVELDSSHRLVISLSGTPQVTLQADDASNISYSILSTPVAFDAWTMVSFVRDGNTFSLGKGTLTTPMVWSIASQSGIASVTSTNFTVSGGGLAYSIHDLTLWSSAKPLTDIEVVRNPTFTKSQVPYPTPFIESLNKDSRYAVRIVSSGFAYPEIYDVKTVSYNPGFALRYDYSALYRADQAFVQVGLGDGAAVRGSYPLGMRGLDIDGFGNSLVSASYAPSLGYNKAWGTDNVSPTVISVVAPFGSNGGTGSTSTLAASPWPNTVLANSAVSRIYVKGDTGSVYRVYLDDIGSGPTLNAELILRQRPESGVTPVYRDEPTDSVTVIGNSAGYVLSVATQGTVYQKTDGTQTFTTPPVQMYRQTKQYLAALSAYSRWSNPNSFGQSISTAALNGNGFLLFSNSEALPSGTHEFSLDVSNVGTVDPDFNGFSTTISIVDSSGSVVSSSPQVLLPNGTGLNPRGTTKFNVALSSALSGPWILKIDWNNFRFVRTTGQIRQLAVNGFSVRLISPSLYTVSLNPLTLSLVDTTSTAVSNRPGGQYATINSYGTIAAVNHEAAVFPHSSAWPLSNMLTTSTPLRRERLLALNPVISIDPGTTTPPSIVNFNPPGSLFNIGDSVNLTVGTAGTVSSYVWRFWDSTVEVTPSGTISKRITPGTVNFTGSVSVCAYDNNGAFACAYGLVNINTPPALSVVSGQRAGILPYTTVINATYTDTTSVSVLWKDDTGTTVLGSASGSYTATRPVVLTAVATDSQGGITRKNLPLDGQPRRNPTVSAIIRNDTGRISLTNTMNFSVYGMDPNKGNPLTFLWTFWDGTTSSGTTTAVSNSNSKFNKATKALVGSTAGLKTVTVTVTDDSGFSTTVSTTVTLNNNVPPTITKIFVAAPGALAGSTVSFGATAADQDGDTVAYTWTFSTPVAMTLFGGNVQYPTSVGQVGQSITGTLTIADGNGGTASQAIPTVSLANSSLTALTVGVAPGYYQTGFAQTIQTSDTSATVRYTLDGTEVFNPTDGILYTGPFMMIPPAGGTGSVTLIARSFKAAAAPSQEFVGSYTFYNPNASSTDTSATSSDITLLTLNSNTDSVITTTTGAAIPGDNGTTQTAPSNLTGQAATTTPEPNLPYLPPPPPGAPIVDINQSSGKFVTLKQPL